MCTQHDRQNNKFLFRGLRKKRSSRTPHPIYQRLHNKVGAVFSPHPSPHLAMLWDRRQRQDEIPQLCRFWGGGGLVKKKQKKKTNNVTPNMSWAFFTQTPDPRCAKLRWHFCQYACNASALQLPMHIQCNAMQVRCNYHALQVRCRDRRDRCRDRCILCRDRRDRLSKIFF